MLQEINPPCMIVFPGTLKVELPAEVVMAAVVCVLAFSGPSRATSQLRHESDW